MDSAVELEALLRVNPPGRYPLRQTIRVDPAAPAFLQEMGVVVTAERARLEDLARLHRFQAQALPIDAGVLSWPGTVFRAAD
ncbi:MAG TPA: hypothetical protein VJ301_04300, partial [Propionibacteriaceae bacterium]|nr:hypothetical protein [Propionibacteriaceae bacterium]